jgi:hypothetical protein
MLEGTALETIDELTLEELVIYKINEGKKYDYKKERVGDTDGQKKEFLSDVSSFANCVGGHLIIGIEEDKGLPIKIVGLNIDNDDKEKNRLDQMIQTGIAPRMTPTHQIHIVSLKNIRKVIVIRIYRSLTKPHMVTFQDSNKFYSRNSHGKYLLDVGEIRSHFLMSESAIQRVKGFWMDRLGIINRGETHIPPDKPKIVMHIVPLSISEPTNIIDVTKLDNYALLYPMGTEKYKKRYNFDGLLLYDDYHEDMQRYPYTYTQLFRNGCIESVETFTLRIKEGNVKGIPGIKFEEVLVEALSRHLLFLKNIGIEPPFFVMVSLLGVSGYSMITRDEEGIVGILGDSIDRNDLMLPEVYIDAFDIVPSKVLKPIFDSIWNSCGWRGSQNYDKDGNWKISNSK